VERLQAARVGKEEPKAAERWRGGAGAVIGTVFAGAVVVVVCHGIWALKDGWCRAWRVNRNPVVLRVQRSADRNAPRRREAAEDGRQVLVLVGGQRGACAAGKANVSKAQPRLGCRGGDVCDVDAGVAWYGIEEGELEHDGQMVLGRGLDDALNVQVEEGLGRLPKGVRDDPVEATAAGRWSGDQPMVSRGKAKPQVLDSVDGVLDSVDGSDEADLVAEQGGPWMGRVPEAEPARFGTHGGEVSREVDDAEPTCLAGEQAHRGGRVKAGGNRACLFTAAAGGHKAVDDPLHVE
jgi:hypothetical protein